MRSFSNAVLLFSTLSMSLATSPWSNPCFGDVCTATTFQYSMTIKGPREAISDISEAADWVILECDPKATAQEIRLVCRGPESSSGCKHLFEAGGPVNKVVRLPPQCGEEGFARISDVWIHENQDIPESISLEALDSAPIVRGLAFDSDFGSIPPLSEPIKFAYKSATHRAKSELEKRNAAGGQALDSPGLNWFGDTTDWIAKEANEVVNAIESIDKFDKKYDFVVPIINKTLEYSLLPPDFTCTLGNDSISGGFHAKASAEADLGFAAGIHVSGFVAPPKVTDFRMYGKLRGHVAGSLKLAGKVFGSVDTNDVVLLDLPLLIPGIPNLLSLGPKFELVVRVKGDLNLAFEEEINFRYKMDRIRLFFPQTDEYQNQGSIIASDSPLTLKLGNTGPSTMNVSVHIMPRIAVGITVPGGRADLFADFDFSGITTLNFDKAAFASDNDVRRAGRIAAKSRYRERPTDLADSEDTSNQLESRNIVTDLLSTGLSKAGLKGCAYVGFDAGAHTGCSASFFSLFNVDSADHEIELFKPLSFEFLKFCTSKQKLDKHTPPEPEPLRISDDFAEKGHPEGLEGAGFYRRSMPSTSSLVRRELTCSKSFNPSKLSTLVSGVVRPERTD